MDDVVRNEILRASESIRGVLLLQQQHNLRRIARARVMLNRGKLRRGVRMIRRANETSIALATARQELQLLVALALGGTDPDKPSGLMIENNACLNGDGASLGPTGH